MSEKLPSHFVDLVRDALLKSFWRKPTLRQFLLRHRVKEAFLATWAPEETKRDILDRLFPKLETTDDGRQVIKQIAVSLSEQIAFPDLKGWEDEALKLANATEAVNNLKKYVQSVRADEGKERERQAIKEAARKTRAQKLAETSSIEALGKQLAELVQLQGTQDGGYKFQDWFYRLADFLKLNAEGLTFRVDAR